MLIFDLTSNLYIYNACIYIHSIWSLHIFIVDRWLLASKLDVNRGNKGGGGDFTRGIIFLSDLDHTRGKKDPILIGQKITLFLPGMVCLTSAVDGTWNTNNQFTTIYNKIEKSKTYWHPTVNIRILLNPLNLVLISLFVGAWEGSLYREWKHYYSYSLSSDHWPAFVIMKPIQPRSYRSHL